MYDISISNRVVIGSILAIAALVLFITGVSQARAAGATSFSTVLSGANEVPAVPATSTEVTTGSSQVTIDSDSALTYRLAATSTSPITGAHLHCGLPGATGPIVLPLALNVSSSSASSSNATAHQTATSSAIAATAQSCSPAITDILDLTSAIQNGRIYVNVHTTAFPSGAARGQLMAVATATATSTPATTTPTTASTTIMVMKHLCTSVQNMSQFEAIEQGLTPAQAIARTVLACPTTALPGDIAATGTVAAPRTNFGFSLSAGTTTKTLSNAMFENEKVCENNINFDVDNNGAIATSTCLDLSHYAFPKVTGNAVTITETSAPAGTHFGTLRFTPTAIMANNDADSLGSINAASGTIVLNVASDTDRMIMLHVYNFKDATSTATTTPPTGTTTPPTGTTTVPRFPHFPHIFTGGSSKINLEALFNDIAKLQSDIFARVRHLQNR